ARATDAAPGTKSIWNSTYRIGGNPCKSSGKTSEKSRIVGTSLSRFSFDFLGARYNSQPRLTSSVTTLTLDYQKLISIWTTYNLLIIVDDGMVLCQLIHTEDNIETTKFYGY
ncbi:hypothetical protein Tco_1285423, partial [Tanacetum coccineum]